MTALDRARLVIDLDALAHNRAVLAAEAAGAEVAAVVKADGYGLGATPVARRLLAEGVTRFFVARLAEGEALRSALGRNATIYVLDGLLPGSADRLSASGLTPVLATPAQVAAAAGFPGSLAIQVDTGMHRQGLTLDDARRLAGAVEVDLVMSHLGSASEPRDARNAAQLELFRAARALFPAAKASLGASAGAFLGPDYRYDVVRGGISLYGGGPEDRPDPRLKAVATLTAPLLDVRNLQAGDRVSYGEVFTADRAMRVGIVGAGYADGIVRSAAGKARVWAGGRPRRLLAVNMDLSIIELDDAPASGEPVEILGENARLDDLAQAAGTVAHEILVRLSTRAERIYRGA